MNSRAKGARGERELAALLREHGYDAIRGQQFRGGKDSPDVICRELDGVHIECKRTERFRLYDSLAQAVRDAGDKMPVVAHRANDCEWVFVLRAEDFFRLVREAGLP